MKHNLLWVPMMTTFHSEKSSTLPSIAKTLVDAAPVLGSRTPYSSSNIGTHQHCSSSTFSPCSPSLHNRNNNRVLVICGPSGVGKGTLIAKLFQEFPGKFGFSVSHTSRPQRPGEVDGRDYFFRTEAEILQLVAQRQFLEHTRTFGHFYGTSCAAVLDVIRDANKICIIEIDVKGVQQLQQQPSQLLDGAGIAYVFVRPKNISVLRERLLRRNTESIEKVEERLRVASMELAAQEHMDFDHVLINDNLDVAFEELKDVVSHLCSRPLGLLLSPLLPLPSSSSEAPSSTIATP